jgi:putative ABC transport system permease protein
VVMDELHELHAHWSTNEGRGVADHRYRKQLHQYPFLLLKRKLSDARSFGWGLMPVRNAFHAVRSLAKVPVLTAAIVATVGVGIGGCTVIFAVVDVLFLRPLPYPDADRLVWIYSDSPRGPFPFSVVDFQALEEEQTSFDAVAAYSYDEHTLTTEYMAERVTVASVTPGYLELMGIDPAVGRPPRQEEGDPAAAPTIVITPGFASRYLGAATPGAADALGQTVKLDGVDYQVIGVIPDDFGPLASWAEAFTTLRLEPPPRKGPFFLSAFGRLRDAADPAVAAEELRVINARIFPLWADSYQDQGTSWGMQPLGERLQGDVGGLLFVLMGSVGLLLLTATANAANLLLARVGGRRRELAVRAALGASRGRIVGLLLTETTLLAVGGVAVGLLGAHWAMGVLPAVASGYIPRLSELSLSGPVLGFAVALAVGSGLLFGLISAFQGSDGELGSALRAGGRTATQSQGQQRAQTALVVGQLALAVPLLAGAGLLVSSFANMYRVNLGFDADRLVSVHVPLDGNEYPDPTARAFFWDEALDQITAIPGVLSVGVGSGRPPADVSMTNNFNLEDKPTPPGSVEPSVPWVLADNGYFQAMGIPHLAGRLFEPSDLDDEAPPVILVDEAWARRFFPGEEVLGRRLVSGGCTTCPLTTVVGVVGTVPYGGVLTTDEGAVYSPGGREILSNPTLHVRAAGDPAQLIPQIRQEIRGIDPTIPLADFATGETLLEESLSRPRHLSLLLGSFSTVALILAVVGLYGIMAYSVHTRRGDIAIRLALGGSPGGVLRMVIGQGMAMVLMGLVLGVAGALAFTRVLSDLLFGVEPNDPLTIAAVAVLLASVSLVACALPGRRAVRVNPVDALRQE